LIQFGLKFAQFFEKMKKLEMDLQKIVQDAVPYAPSLDFSDPRNSQYIPLLF
jgi:hypothetical protein